MGEKQQKKVLKSGFAERLCGAAVALSTMLVLGVTGEAKAGGALQVGEVVFTSVASGPRFIGRMDPTDPDSFEEIIDDHDDTIAAEVVAIANRNTIYAVVRDAANLKFLVWQVDVQSGLMSLKAEVHYVDYGWIVEPYAEALEIEADGKLLLLVAGREGMGHILRVDPALAATQTPEVVLASSALQGSNLGTDMKVAASGDIYVADSTGLFETYRVQDNTPAASTLVPVWNSVDPSSYGYSPGYPSVKGGGRALEIDPLTGHLLLVCTAHIPQEICSADPNTSVLTMVPTGLTAAPRETIAKGRTGDIVASYTISADDVEFVLPECSDGIDNDEDGDVDFPNDAECNGADDKREAPQPTCQSSISPIEGAAPTSVLLIATLAALSFGRRRYLA